MASATIATKTSDYSYQGHNDNGNNHDDDSNNSSSNRAGRNINDTLNHTNHCININNDSSAKGHDTKGQLLTTKLRPHS